MIRKIEVVNRNRELNSDFIKRFKYGTYKNNDDMMQIKIVDHLKLMITFTILQNVVDILYLPQLLTDFVGCVVLGVI